MKKYTLDHVQDFIDMYVQEGGEIVASCEGGIGWGTMILKGEGLKTCVIDEEYLNEWSSKHTLYMHPGDAAKKWYDKIEKANAIDSANAYAEDMLNELEEMMS